MNDRKKILIISPEVYPQVKVGGLGVVAAGVAKEFEKRNVDLRVVSPKKSIYQPIWAENTKNNYYQLGKQAVELCRNEDWQPDIVWTHDWGGVWSRQGYGRLPEGSKSVWTVHSPIGDEYSYNYNYGGYGYGYGYGWEETNDEPIDWGDSFFDFSGLINQGIRQSDLVTTVSEGYARRLSRHSFFKQAKKIDYISNGLDFDAWSPQKDSLVGFNLQDSWLEFKQRNKKVVQEQFNLPKKDVPVYCFVSRVVPQKGVKLMLEVLPEFLGKNDAQFVLVGSGRRKLEDRIKKLEELFPTKVGTRLEADFELPHQVYAGSDFLILPSVAEPFGLVVAEAKKYRVVPIVHLVDGIKDQVKDEQNGFGFYYYNKERFTKKLYQSLRYWQCGGFRRGLAKPRKIDSWQKAANGWLNLFYGQA